MVLILHSAYFYKMLIARWSTQKRLVLKVSLLLPNPMIKQLLPNTLFLMDSNWMQLTKPLVLLSMPTLCVNQLVRSRVLLVNQIVLVLILMLHGWFGSIAITKRLILVIMRLKNMLLVLTGVAKEVMSMPLNSNTLFPLKSLTTELKVE